MAKNKLVEQLYKQERRALKAIEAYLHDTVLL